MIPARSAARATASSPSEWAIRLNPVGARTKGILSFRPTTVVLMWIPKTGFGKDVVHSSTLAEARAAETELSEGQVGVTESDLRPAGFARFGELRQSVVTEGEFIAASSKIVVTRVQGSRIVVEIAPESEES